MTKPPSARDEALQDKLEMQLFKDVTRLLEASAWQGIGPEATSSALARSLAYVLVICCHTEASRKEVRDMMPEMIALHEKQLLEQIAKKEAANKTRSTH